ncbi:MAG: hypothetical protein A2Z29_02165 [Chloroflexi bacterium RBG_16_56_11]|nr:MAG: hypothetical protein A2Z29_02165 [Chloroflexi bacterium RBG_16_56_11]
MESKLSLSSGWEKRLARIPSPLLIVIGPFLGLVYISLVPIVTVATFIVTGGFYALHRLEFKRPVPIKPSIPR